MKWHGGDFVIKMKGQDDMTIILILGFPSWYKSKPAAEQSRL
jgi:hypothetical protein